MEKVTAIIETDQVLSESSTNSIILHKDSAGLDFRLEIWPKGNFKFSPAKGFEGEAEKVLLTGTGIKTGLMVQKVEQLENQEELKTTDLQRREVLKTEVNAVQKSTNPSLMVLLVFGLILLVLIIMIWKHSGQS